MTRSRAHVARTVLLGTSCLFTAAMLTSVQAGGLPTGGTVVSGKVTISSPNDHSTVIKQSSDKAIITWDDFSIASGSSVTFKQPDANAIALNRVTGSTPSTINGDLFANGHVWLINGNGLLFGKGAQVNVGSLIATTADMSDANFLSGNYKFGSPSSNPNAGIVNNGLIRASKGGSVILAGPVVSNNGFIQADLGNVTLGGVSTFTVDFTGDNLLRFAVGKPMQQTPVDANGHPVQSLVSNSGTISAKGGTVVMTTRAAESVVNNVINNTGMIEATSVGVQNGEVILDAGGGDVVDSGSIYVSGKQGNQTGGNITVEAKNITVADHATLDASGNKGGGTILIGGDAHGKGAVKHASTSTVGKATINASALVSGDGGKIVVWSDDQTSVAGRIIARGGDASGDGGFIETSGGHLEVAKNAKVVTLAPGGSDGVWLLDPATIVIENGGGNPITDGSDPLSHNGGGTDSIDPTAITNALATTNVMLEATGTIHVWDPVVYSSTHTLSLLAQGDLDVQHDIRNTRATNGGAINLIAGWNGFTRDLAHLADDGVYGKNGHQVFIGGEGANSAIVGAASGLVTIAASDVIVDAEQGISQIGYNGAGGGDIRVFATDDLFVYSNGGYAQIGNGSTSDGALTGNVTGNISLNVADALQIQDFSDGSGGDAFNPPNAGFGRPVWIGNVAGAGFHETGDVSIRTGTVGYSQGDDVVAPDTLTDMIAADLGTSVTTGGDFTLALTNSSTFLDKVIGKEALNYSSPHDLTIVSTKNVNIPYSIQNSGTGDLTILAGWDKTVAPTSALAQGAYGRNGTSIWVVGQVGALLDTDTNESDTGINSGGGSSVGSKGGTTTIAASQIYVEGLGGFGQIGYHGSGGSGAINVIANGTPSGSATGISACFNGTGNVCVIGGRTGFASGGYAQIGNLGMGVAGTSTANVNVTATGNISVSSGGNYASDGSDHVTNAYGLIGSGDATRSVNQTVSGNVSVRAGDALNIFTSTASGSVAWIGNRTGADGNASGNVSLFGTDIGDGDHADGIVFAAMLGADLGSSSTTGGDVLVALTGDFAFGNALVYSSPHALSLLSTGGLWITNSIQNSGSGDINLVAGWDGTTLNPSRFLRDGVYGNGNNSNVIIGAEGNQNASIVGTAHGVLNVAGNGVDVAGSGNDAQLGFRGSADGDINVFAINTVQVLSSIFGNVNAQIGNLSNAPGNAVSGNITIKAKDLEGAPGEDSTIRIGNGGSGTAGGNIVVNLSGEFSVDRDIPFIGNFGSTSTGNLTVTAGTISNIEASLENDLGFGDVSLRATNTEVGLGLGDIEYNSSHTLTVLSTGDIDIFGSIQNSGSGAINLVAGWNGTTTNASRFTNTGVFGNNGGSITLGGAESDTALVGSKSGTLTVAGYDISLIGEDGDTQLGYHGAGTGNITVVAAHNLLLNADNYYAQIGSGGENVSGNDSGNIFVSAGGTVSLLANDAGAHIGHGGWDSQGNDSGTITVNAVGNINITGAANSLYGYAQIGHGGLDSRGNDSGAISVTSNGTVNLTAGNSGLYAQIGHGGGADGWGNSTGDVAVTAAGLTFTGTNNDTGNDFAQIGNNAYVNGDAPGSGHATGNILVTVGGTTRLNTSAGQRNVFIGNSSGTVGLASGNVTLLTGSLNTSNDLNNSLDSFITADLAGGNFILGARNSEVPLNVGGIVYNSANSLTLLSAGDLVISGDIQNSGSGAITAVAGWNGSLDPARPTRGGAGPLRTVIVGGDNASGNAAIGSKHGSTTILGGEVDVLANHGDAQIGYRGTADGAIGVTSGHNILVTTSGAHTAQIGNGSVSAGGNIRGSITLNATDSIFLATNATGAIAAIGNLGASGASESGDISVTAGGGLTLAAGASSRAAIGNWSQVFTETPSTANAGGNIDITAATINLTALGTNAQAQIGNGRANGSATGDITIHSGNILLTGGGNAGFARIGHNPDEDGASVKGNINIVSTGIVSLLSGPDLGSTNASAAIGSGTSGDITGDITVTANAVSLYGGGGHSQSRIGNAGNTVKGNIAVTAAGDLALVASGNAAAAFIGSQALIGNGNTSVTSTGGNITVNAAGDNSNARIGSGAGNSLTGNVLVQTTAGDINILASGANALGAIGPLGLGADPLVFDGTITVNAAGTLQLASSGAGATAQIGNHSGGTANIIVNASVLDLFGGGTTTGTALIGNGSFDDDASGNVGGDITINVTGSTVLAATAGRTWIGNVVPNGATGSGNLVLVTADIDDNNPGNVVGDFVAAGLLNGDVTLGFTAPSDPVRVDGVVATNSSHTFNLLSTGDILIASTLRNDGTGGINVVAGWDGTTLNAAHFGDANVYGNHGAGVKIGGSGDALLGSAGGTTSVYGDYLTLAAKNGYAQLGFNGAGTGAIVVNVLGDVTLTGGASDGFLAQIGNGGRLATGNDSGDITVNAGGDVKLKGGAGTESYAQIGHGGARNNLNSDGYQLTGLVTVSGDDVILDAGTGDAAYVQIGHGGFKTGTGLTGTALVNGAVLVTALHNVSISGGGDDAYAQIGNGGDRMNFGASAAAHGSIGGNTTVNAPNGSAGSVTLTAGSGDNAYAMIGNGGYAINFSNDAVAANFSISGNTNVTDLSLTGGSGANTFAQIGNGDNSHTGIGNISGNITIDVGSGNVTLTDGTGKNSGADIQNATGDGKVTGKVSGFTDDRGGDIDPGDEVKKPETQGTLVTLADNKPNQPVQTNTNIPEVILTTEVETPETTNTNTASNPIEEMSGGEGDVKLSDKASESLGTSLNAGKKPAGQVIIGGILKQQGLGGQTFKPHATPKADEDYSSWGNEALWQ